MLTLVLAVLTLSKGADAFIDGDNLGGLKNSFLSNPSELWSNGIVPFVFETIVFLGGEEEPIFAESEKEMIREAMANIEELVPCIRFR